LLAAHPSLSRENIYTAAAVGDVAAVQEMLAANPGLASLRGGPHHWEPSNASRLNSEAKAIPHWTSRVCCWHTRPTRTQAFSGMAAMFHADRAFGQGR
jgi:hypothetical protein